MSSESIIPYDIDPIETQEWLDAFNSVLMNEDKERAQFILRQLTDHATTLGIAAPQGIHTPYVNTLPTELEAQLPDDDIVVLEKLTNYMRWNVLAMVIRATRKKEGLGGHISTYASIATLYEVGLNYFFRANDLVFFQGHSSEGIYARAFLEGRISEAQLSHFREEAFTQGLSSYPHPYLMPDFWQFPTVSMGLGPLMGIYQAQMLKYVHHRGLTDTKDRKVWVFCGDGETNEPESLGALLVASREKLDNLIFIVNCNLQRLDGPVSGNGQIIQELEGVFAGSGWRVIKVIWGGSWDLLFKKDPSGLLMKRMGELVDGEYQSYSAKGGAYFREHFFGKYPELSSLVSDMTDQDLKQLLDGGHDPQKVYAAYMNAIQQNDGRPTVILLKTVKGFGYGGEGEGQNITHNLEEISTAGLKTFCRRFDLPLSDQDIEKLSFLALDKDKDSQALHYLTSQREKLGGPLPARDKSCETLKVPNLDVFKPVLVGSGDRAVSTTAAFSRIMMLLLKDKTVARYIVPIVADEARSLGWEALFRQIGIYSPEKQKYTPEDQGKLISYREMESGQLLQQGISEAGAMASWIAAATSYVNNRLPLIPVYQYYAMFGYQRVGDLIWASADMQARGFIVGGLAGRTTLPGEGLQHQDSHNLLMYSAVPTCRSYDPAFGYELAVIVQDGLYRMYEKQEDVFYYLTVMSESYQQPPMPKGVEKGIIAGMYLFQSGKQQSKKRVQLLGSGAILREVIAAAAILEKEYQVSADVWSVPSFNLLRRDIESVRRYNQLHPAAIKPRVSHVEQCLVKHKGPVVAATDYMRLMADQIRSAVKQPYYVLGTDGFGRSDSRKVLRDFFEVNTPMIVYTALYALTMDGDFKQSDLTQAMKSLDIDVSRPDPWIV